MRKLSLIATVLGVAFIAGVITSCGDNKINSYGDTEDVTYLHVYNWEDYIYLNDPESGYEEADMTEQFEEFINQPENKEMYGLSKDVKVIYDTFDTPETMYNQLKLNKTSYDIMCPSDYMIQRLARNADGLESTKIRKIDFDKMPNYTTYVSKFLTGNLESVSIDENDPSKGTLADYAVGYMWGTLGLVYNPGSQALLNKGYTEDEIIEAFDAADAWDLLWENDDFAKVASIKDSIRDTYAMAVMHVYSDELKELASLYEEGKISRDSYKKQVNAIFNRCDNETIQKVQEALIELKTRIYGFEVDTGKTDIVTGKIAVNLAWSGDAVYSMDDAEEYEQYFYYALPALGANIWFDGWCIPESCTGEHLNAAYAFLDFLAMPVNAAQNMDYIGYTTFMAGDDVLDLIHDWYDAEDEENSVEYDLSYFFEGTLDEYDLDYAIIETDEEQTIRQLHAQYPEYDEIDHLCIMKDFGKANDTIVTMWENVKVNPLPLWVKVFVITALVSFIAYLGSYKIIRRAKLNKRRKLRGE